MKSPAPRNSKIQDIEVLRALAVLAVLWQHIANLLPFSYTPFHNAAKYFGGTFGVDLFFCISGFVIARDLVPRLTAVPREKVWRQAMAFWVKRMWRLWPAAWVWLLAIFLCVVFFNESGAFGSFEENTRATWAAVFHLYNVYFVHCFMRCGAVGSLVYWSLSLEEQFYLLFPVMIIIFRRRLWLPLAALVIVQLLLPQRNLWWMAFRSDAICLGVFIALCSNGPYWQHVVRWVNKMPRCAGLLLLAGGVGVMGSLSGTEKWASHYMSWIALVSAMLVLVAAADAQTLMPRGPFKRLLMAIGARSYGIYLAHIPVYFATREIFHRLELNLAATPASVALAVAVAAPLLLVTVEFVYRLIEMPLRHLGAAKAKRWAAGAPHTAR